MNPALIEIAGRLLRWMLTHEIIETEEYICSKEEILFVVGIDGIM
jgi:hypothetical protein